MTLSIKPFKALRPKTSLLNKVVMPAFDNLKENELLKIMKNSKWNFLNVISPEAFYPGISKSLSKKHSVEHLSSMIDNNIVFLEKKESYYIYRLTKYNKSQFGVIASVDIKKNNPLILKHENILKARSDRILKTIKNTNLQVGPVYLSHNSKTNLKTIYKKISTKKPIYNFKSSGGTLHSLWKIDDEKNFLHIKENLKKIKKLYIADGHHRFSSMEKLQAFYTKKNKSNKSVPLLSVIFDQADVNILSYNKLIKFKKFKYEKFIKNLSKNFPSLSIAGFKEPKTRGNVSIYCNKKWHMFNIRNDKIKKQQKITDSELIEKLILKKLLVEKTNHKILNKMHLPGKFGYKVMQQKVDKKAADIGFFICPMTMHEIMSVANDNKIVPPKSTFFDPKPADGLITLLMKE